MSSLLRLLTLLLLVHHGLAAEILPNRHSNREHEYDSNEHVDADFQHPEVACKQQFTSWNGKCYYAAEEKLNYYKAWSRCKDLGSELVSIHSSGENQYVLKIAQHLYTWIGMKKQNKRYWEWTDETKINFRNWGPFQPDGCCGIDVNCGVMNFLFKTGHWYDSPCTNEHGFVCKYVPKVQSSDNGQIKKQPAENWQRDLKGKSEAKLAKQPSFLRLLLEAAENEINDSEQTAEPAKLYPPSDNTERPADHYRKTPTLPSARDRGQDPKSPQMSISTLISSGIHMLSGNRNNHTRVRRSIGNTVSSQKNPSNLSGNQHSPDDLFQEENPNELLDALGEPTVGSGSQPSAGTGPPKGSQHAHGHATHGQPAHVHPPQGRYAHGHSPQVHQAQHSNSPRSQHQQVHYVQAPPQKPIFLSYPESNPIVVQLPTPKAHVPRLPQQQPVYVVQQPQQRVQVQPPKQGYDYQQPRPQPIRNPPRPRYPQYTYQRPLPPPPPRRPVCPYAAPYRCPHTQNPAHQGPCAYHSGCPLARPPPPPPNYPPPNPPPPPPNYPPPNPPPPPPNYPPPTPPPPPPPPRPYIPPSSYYPPRQHTFYPKPPPPPYHYPYPSKKHNETHPVPEHPYINLNIHSHHYAYPPPPELGNHTKTNSSGPHYAPLNGNDSNHHSYVPSPFHYPYPNQHDQPGHHADWRNQSEQLHSHPAPPPFIYPPQYYPLPLPSPPSPHPNSQPEPPRGEPPPPPMSPHFPPLMKHSHGDLSSPPPVYTYQHTVHHHHYSDQQHNPMPEKNRKCACPEGWKLYGNHCYEVSKEPKLVRKSGAFERCEQKNSVLAVSCEMEEKMMINELVKAKVELDRRDMPKLEETGGCFNTTDIPVKSCCRASWVYLKNVVRELVFRGSHKKCVIEKIYTSVFACKKSCHSSE